jgi:endonuclease/exonuclease/phosphatase family metal-dependent hydrolase
MSFNIRFDTPADDRTKNRWKHRAQSVIETVQRFSPHVVGFQEALRPQLEDLIAAFPEYHVVGKPREAGEVGEYVPIFLHKQWLEAEDSGDFWLSPTPETEGSTGWDAGNPRHCTWVRVRDRARDVTFAVFNTHLDRWGVLARLEAARLIVARIAVAPDLPSVVLGDFNAEEDSDALAAFLEAGFRDTFREIHPNAVDVQTVHHYAGFKGTRKIDYILCDRRWAVTGADIVRAPAAERLPSDHFPVVAELRPPL